MFVAGITVSETGLDEAANAEKRTTTPVIKVVTSLPSIRIGR